MAGIEERRKTVCFPKDPSDLVLCYPCIPLLSELSLEDRKLRWFSASEHDESKQKLSLTAREIRKYGYSKLLDKVFDGEDASTSFELLERWSRHSYSGRGVERHCNRRHGSRRKAMQERCIIRVLLAQKEAQNVSNSYDDRVEIIAKASEDASKEARQFGLNMGLADAKAILPSKKVDLFNGRSRISTSILYHVTPQVGLMSRSPSS